MSRSTPDPESFAKAGWPPSLISTHSAPALHLQVSGPACFVAAECHEVPFFRANPLETAVQGTAALLVVESG